MPAILLKLGALHHMWHKGSMGTVHLQQLPVSGGPNAPALAPLPCTNLAQEGQHFLVWLWSGREAVDEQAVGIRAEVAQMLDSEMGALMRVPPIVLRALQAGTCMSGSVLARCSACDARCMHTHGVDDHSVCGSCLSCRVVASLQLQRLTGVPLMAQAAGVQIQPRLFGHRASCRHHRVLARAPQSEQNQPCCSCPNAAWGCIGEGQQKE